MQWRIIAVRQKSSVLKCNSCSGTRREFRAMIGKPRESLRHPPPAVLITQPKPFRSWILQPAFIKQPKGWQKPSWAKASLVPTAEWQQNRRKSLPTRADAPTHRGAGFQPACPDAIMTQYLTSAIPKHGETIPGTN